MKLATDTLSYNIPRCNKFDMHYSSHWSIWYSRPLLQKKEKRIRFCFSAPRPTICDICIPSRDAEMDLKDMSRDYIISVHDICVPSIKTELYWRYNSSFLTEGVAFNLATFDLCHVARNKQHHRVDVLFSPTPTYVFLPFFKMSCTG